MSREEFGLEFPAESEFLEFKAGTSAKTLQDSVVAFSNHRGGVLLIGVDDTGTPRGRPLDAGTADAIHQALSEAHDLGRYELHHLQVGDTGITVISVSRREEGFAQTSGGVVRIRRGSRDDALFGADLQRFVNERSFTRYENTQTSLAVDAVDPALLDALASAFGWRSASVLTDRLAEHGYVADGRLTVAGLLYLDPDPAAILGKAYVEVLRYADDVGTAYDRRDELRGPLHVQLGNAVDRIQDHLGTELVVLGTHRYELPRIPEVVLREAVANALAHRSYEASGTPVRIELRPSEIRITSPGGLPEPVTIQNIRETNAARNLDVIRALRRFGLAEDAGRGVDVMQDTMEDEMLDPPRFADLGHAVEVVLPVRSAVAPIERAWVRELEHRGALAGPDRLLLVHAARGDVLTNARARAILNLDADAARETLQRLRDAELLEQRGTRGGATYYLGPGLHPPAGLRLAADELATVVEGLAEAEPITNATVRAATGLDRDQALAVLDRLVREGRLEREGERRGTRYRRP